MFLVSVDASTVERRLSGQLGTERMPVNRFPRIMVQEMSHSYKI